MEEHELADKLLRELFTIVGALVDLQLRHMSDEARARVFDAVRNRTGRVELRTCVESGETELVLVPTDGTEPLWLARTGDRSKVGADDRLFVSQATSAIVRH